MEVEAGIEPANPFGPVVFKTMSSSVPDLYHSAGDRTRTCTYRGLNPMPLPVGLHQPESLIPSDSQLLNLKGEWLIGDKELHPATNLNKRIRVGCKEVP